MSHVLRIHVALFSIFSKSFDSCVRINWIPKLMLQFCCLRVNLGTAQVDQTHVARDGCNVIYITYVTRAGVALQATVENIRDFVWEIYHWDLRTPNNVKPYFFLNEMNKKVLPAIYSAAVWCLFVVLLLLAPPRQGSNMTLALCEGSRVQVGNDLR